MRINTIELPQLSEKHSSNVAEEEKSIFSQMYRDSLE